MTVIEAKAELYQRGYPSAELAENPHNRGCRVTIETGKALVRIEADDWESVLLYLPALPKEQA